MRVVGDVEGEGFGFAGILLFEVDDLFMLRAVTMTLSPALRTSSARRRPKPVEAPVMRFNGFDLIETTNETLFLGNEAWRGGYASTHSKAAAGPMMRAPREDEDVHLIMFDTPTRGVGVVAHAGAATPGILFEAMQTPTPEPQMRMPRSTAPAISAFPTSTAKSG